MQRSILENIECLHDVEILKGIYPMYSIYTSDVLEHKWRASLKTILFLF